MSCNAAVWRIQRRHHDSGIQHNIHQIQKMQRFWRKMCVLRQNLHFAANVDISAEIEQFSQFCTLKVLWLRKGFVQPRNISLALQMYIVPLKLKEIQKSQFLSQNANFASNYSLQWREQQQCAWWVDILARALLPRL